MRLFIHRRLKLKNVLFSMVFTLFMISSAQGAQTFYLPSTGDNIVGYMQTGKIQRGDTFSRIAERFGVGGQALLQANPGVHPSHLRVGQTVKIPTAYVLPEVPQEGIVINLSEMRLYYYPKGGNVVITAPIAVGRAGWETPISNTKIVEKIQDPVWHVPESIRQASAEKGRYLPEEVPPGPENPLGQYAMRLGLGTYLIHGTNQPASIGQSVSSGCIRMYPEDIQYLFEQVPVGTPVKIINQPYKIGRYRGEYYVEAHPPIENNFSSNEAVERDYRKVIDDFVGSHEEALQWHQIEPMIQEHRGYPQRIL